MRSENSGIEVPDGGSDTPPYPRRTGGSRSSECGCGARSEVGVRQDYRCLAKVRRDFRPSARESLCTLYILRANSQVDNSAVVITIITSIRSLNRTCSIASINPTLKLTPAYLPA